MKYLGIDYGAKVVGLAISNEEGTLAFPRAELVNDSKLMAFLVRMVAEEKVEKIVVGDTLALNRRDNPITQYVEKFVVELSQATAVQTEFAPEMWSSIEASRYAPENQQHNNASAAAIILQRYLEMNADSVG